MAGYDRDLHHRQSIRLKGYDYSQAGAYLVTVCTQHRAVLFGDVVDGQMRLGDPGRMIQSVWQELPKHYPGIGIDAFIVMPNHIHGIIFLLPVGAGPRACPGQPHNRDKNPPVGAGPRACPGQPRGVAPTIPDFDQNTTHDDCCGLGQRWLSLPDVVHRFKSLTTARYRHGVMNQGWPPFAGRLWQRNYFERVIRDEDELSRIREYIVNNPLQWDLDSENPDRTDPS